MDTVKHLPPRGECVRTGRARVAGPLGPSQGHRSFSRTRSAALPRGPRKPPRERGLGRASGDPDRHPARRSWPSPLGNEADGAGLALRKTTGCRGGAPLTARTSMRPTRKMLSQTYQKRRWGGGLKKASQRWNLMRMLKGRGHMEAQRCQGDLGDRRRGDRARAGRAGPYAATELTLVPCHPPGTRGSL